MVIILSVITDQPFSCVGLPGLLASLSLTGQVSELTVVGPVGIKEMIDTNIRLR
jgi:ribonuclease BN (tRNA processing enzyme)